MLIRAIATGNSDRFLMQLLMGETTPVPTTGRTLSRRQPPGNSRSGTKCRVSALRRRLVCRSFKRGEAWCCRSGARRDQHYVGTGGGARFFSFLLCVGAANSHFEYSPRAVVKSETTSDRYCDISTTVLRHRHICDHSAADRPHHLVL